MRIAATVAVADRPTSINPQLFEREARTMCVVFVYDMQLPRREPTCVVDLQLNVIPPQPSALPLRSGRFTYFRYLYVRNMFDKKKHTQHHHHHHHLDLHPLPYEYVL